VSVEHKPNSRREFLRTSVVGLGAVSSQELFAQGISAGGSPMELQIDHVMFPVYFNNPFLNLVEQIWKNQSGGRVTQMPQYPAFKHVLNFSKSFYVEYLSTVQSEPYWSNAVYVVVPKKFWGHYKSPALVTEHYLIPEFGAGYQLVSPEFPHLNSIVAKGEAYDGFTLLISKALETSLLSIGGQKWVLPSNGKIRVHEKLHHAHEMAVINEKSKIVAPVLQSNPVLREFL
jgi:hypothetical protein